MFERTGSCFLSSISWPLALHPSAYLLSYIYIYILNSLLHPMWLSTAVSLPVLRLISCFLILIAVLVRVVAYLHAVRDCR